MAKVKVLVKQFNLLVVMMLLVTRVIQMTGTFKLLTLFQV
jgi:hypothetical protein